MLLQRIYIIVLKVLFHMNTFIVNNNVNNNNNNNNNNSNNNNK